MRRLKKGLLGRPGRRKAPERAGDIKQARDRVAYLVKIGKIRPAKKLACVKCEHKAAEYHHHNGYGIGHHEEVIPLCKTCHSIENSKQNENTYIPLSNDPIPE